MAESTSSSFFQAETYAVEVDSQPTEGEHPSGAKAVWAAWGHLGMLRETAAPGTTVRVVVAATGEPRAQWTRTRAGWRFRCIPNWTR